MQSCFIFSSCSSSVVSKAVLKIVVTASAKIDSRMTGRSHGLLFPFLLMTLFQGGDLNPEGDPSATGLPIEGGARSLGASASGCSGGIAITSISSLSSSSSLSIA